MSKPLGCGPRPCDVFWGCSNAVGCGCITLMLCLVAGLFLIAVVSH